MINKSPGFWSFFLRGRTAKGAGSFCLLIFAVLGLRQICRPENLFSQTVPDFFGDTPFDSGRRVLDYHFDRADRESSPDRWMEEARGGILTAKSVLAEIAPGLFRDAEALAEFAEWSEEELENRFIAWLFERFFGAGKAELSSVLSRKAGEVYERLIYITGADGEILYDERTGDPKIIRPADEGYDFKEDLSSWRETLGGSAEEELDNYREALTEMYPELLMFIPPGREDEFQRKLAEAGELTVYSLERELEAVLAREERYFTAQRLGDVWSLRKKSEDKSAAAIGERLIEEARKACASGIAALEARIEAAGIDGGDLAPAGLEWLDEYRRQYQRGLDAWESAEERFLARRIEWEQSAGRLFAQELESWTGVLARFGEERENWEEKTKILFLEGEQFFASASANLEAAIGAAKLQYEIDAKIRIDAASERSGALANMYALSASAAQEARRNIDFWITRYRDLGNNADVPEEGAALDSWVNRELSRQRGSGKALEVVILEELRDWSALYRSYTAKTEESRGLLARELSASSGLSGVSGSGRDFYPDPYESEIIAAEADLDYWEHRSASALAVASYAEALDAGRSTASESAEAWEKARAAFDKAAALYGNAEASVKTLSAEIAAARDLLSEAAEKMKAADAALAKLRKDYELRAASFGKQGALLIAEETAVLNKELAARREILESVEADSPWGNFIARALELELRQTEEMKKSALNRLVAGSENDLESLSKLAVKAANPVTENDHPVFTFLQSALSEGKISSGEYDALVPALKERLHDFDENQLGLRLAALSFLAEKEDLSVWYSSVNKKYRDGIPRPPDSNMEKLLLSNWEHDRLELLTARAKLELEALDSLSGGEAGSAALILASFYSDDEAGLAPRRELLNWIIPTLDSMTEYFAEMNSAGINIAGILQEDLVGICGEDTEMLSFVLGNSVVCPHYGKEISESLLREYAGKEEFSRGLYNLYIELEDLSPALARENTERGLVQLKRLWATIGTETAGLPFPRTGALIQSLQEFGEANASGLSSLFFILEEIFYPLPSPFGFILNLWKESVNNYCASPNADNLLIAERHTRVLNAAFSALDDKESAEPGFDFAAEALRYFADPFLAWDESAMPPAEPVNSDEYDAALKELRDQYAAEKYIGVEINRLSEISELSARDSKAAETEMKNASAEVASAEKERDKLFSAYQEAENNFKRLGAGYDSLYDKAESAFADLRAAQREFETQDAVRLWAETAYLDVRKPLEELSFCLERKAKAQSIFTLLKSIDPEGNKSPEYGWNLNKYRNSLSQLGLSLDARNKLERAIEAEQQRSESAYRAYQNQLSFFGNRVDINDVSSSGLMGMIRVSGAFLGFKTEAQSSGSGSQALRNYFAKNKSAGGEAYEASSFELGLMELGDYLVSSLASVDEYMKMGLARDHLVREIIKNNPDNEEIKDWYKTSRALKENQNLGNMMILEPFKEKVYELAEHDAPVLEQMQSDAWNSLSSSDKRALEFYTILTLLGGGGSEVEYFSRVSEFHQLTRLYILAHMSHEFIKDKPKGIIELFTYKNKMKEVAVTRDALLLSQEELSAKINLAYTSLKETIDSINEKFIAYKNSSMRLAELKGKSNGIVRWNDLAGSLRLAGIPDRNLNPLKSLWDGIGNSDKSGVRDTLEALNLLIGSSKVAAEESFTDLSRLWETGEEERRTFESGYRELYEAYLEGDVNFEDLKAAALLGFGGSVPSEKKHFENVAGVLLDTLRGFDEKILGGTPEYARLVSEYAGITAGVWEKKYAAILKLREREWELQRKDIREKLSLWRESADIIVEEGRIAWKEGDAKLRAAFDEWLAAFRDEYARTNDRWSAAYLDGLEDKERWAADALRALGEVSSSAALALLGSGAEAGARAMDTRDPALFINPPGAAEAEKIIAELFEKSGTARLASVFDGIKNSPETLAAIVRTGIEGSGALSSGTALTEASIFAGKLREDFEERESRKSAFVLMQTAGDAYRALEDNLRFANDEFKKNMDEVFIVDGQWRRSGSGYMKDVIVHSTLFNSIITDFAEVDGYRYFILPASRLSAYINGEVPPNMNTIQAEALIDSIYSEINDLGKKVFGSGGKDDGGDFGIHIGSEPLIKSEIDIESGKDGIFDDSGSGELGRLLSEFYYWMCKENLGIVLVNTASWEKPMWDSRGSAIHAPTLRSAVDIAVRTGILIAGAAGAPFTAGGSLVGSIALGAALNSADDLLFGLMDVSGGYKSWDEAGFEFGKNFLLNAANSAAGSLFYGLEGSASSFLNSGGISGFFSGNALGGSLGGVVADTLTNGLYTTGSGALSGLLGAVTYESGEGFDFSSGAFIDGLKGAGIGALSGMTGTFTSGIMDLGLTGLTRGLYTDGHTLSGFAGSLASQGVNYAFGDDFVFNLFNAGLVEMHLGQDGLSFEMGGGGAALSVGTLLGALKGLEAWGVNADLLFSGEADALKYASLLRTLYSGDEINNEEYENILAGRTRIVEVDAEETRSVFDRNTGIKTVYLGRDVLEQGGPFALNVILSHESYRDGVNSGPDGQAAELGAAVRGHNETAVALIETYGFGSLGEGMTKEALFYAYAAGNAYDSILESIVSGYDNSADYWKLIHHEGGLWEWIDDKSANFDISILLNTRGYWESGSPGLETISGAIACSRFLDGEDSGIISADRMTPALARILGQTIMHYDASLPVFYGTFSPGINASFGGAQIMRDILINDTLAKLAYNAAHTTTVYDGQGRLVTLHNMDTMNPDVKNLLKQNSDALSHIENMAKAGCNFMDIISLPQMLTRQILGAEEITEIWNQAISKGILKENGLVKNRNALANLALEKLGITNFGIELEDTKRRDQKFIGYRVEVPYGTGGHFVLTGKDKSLVYNPGNTFTSDQSKWKDILEISVYGR